MSSLDHRGAEPLAPGYGKGGGAEPGWRTKYSGYAGFWIRSVALVLDWLILVIPQFLYIVLIGAVMAAFKGNESLEHSIAIGGYVSLIVLIALFCAGMESSPLQGTPGKLVMGLRVTDVHGRRISFGRALGRYCAKILSSTPLAFGLFMAGFTARKQALHDLIAGTLVLKATRSRAWPPPTMTPPRGSPMSSPLDPGPVPRVGSGGPTTSVFATLSLVFGALSPVLICPYSLAVYTAPAAILLGHLARFRIRKSAGQVTGGGLARTGLILGYVSLAGLVAMGTYKAILFKGAENVAKGIFADAEGASLREVERKIATDAEGYADGNTPQARDLAKKFATLMDRLSLVTLTATDAKREVKRKPSAGHYATWCELRPGRCAFIVHVRGYRGYDDDARETLDMMAWQTAQRYTKGILKEGAPLAVGLKGDLLYGSVMVGKATELTYDGPNGLEDSGADKARLYPFFAPDVDESAPAKVPERDHESVADREGSGDPR